MRLLSLCFVLLFPACLRADSVSWFWDRDPSTAIWDDFYVGSSLNWNHHLDFSGLSSNEPIQNQFASPSPVGPGTVGYVPVICWICTGVGFSGPFYGNTNSGDTDLFGVSVIASNWRSNGPNDMSIPVMATFAGAISRAGFLVETNDADVTEVTLYRSGRVLYTFTFDTRILPTFIGVGATEGFDQMSFRAVQGASGGFSNGFIGLNRFSYAGGPVGVGMVAPEPSAYLLSVTAFAALCVAGLRRRRIP